MAKKIAKKPGYAAMRVLEFIPDGKENAISRKELADITGYNDSALRGIIKCLRDNRYLIGADMNGKGYFIARNEEELLPTLNDLKAKRNSLAREINALEKGLAEQLYVLPNEL